MGVICWIAPPTDTNEPMTNDDFTPGTQPPPRTLGAWLSRLFGRDTDAEREQRLANLNRAVTQYPDAAANYLLRGELHAEMRRYDDAAADLQRVVTLAGDAYAARRWGVVAQTVRDRALYLLDEVTRELLDV